jgi:multiple sugar transport system substrate-binding protein
MKEESMKKFSTLLIIALLVLSVAATSFAGGQKDAGTAAATQKTKVTYWFFPIFINVPGYEAQSSAHGEYEKFLAAEFMKANPNIEVVAELQPWEGGVDKVNVAIAGGNPPEIVADYLGRTGGWFTQGAGVDLNPIISQKMKDDLIPSFKDLYTIDGKLHAYPMMAWVQMMLINQFVFEKYGVGNVLPANGTPISIDQFKAALQAAKKAFPQGTYPFGMACGSEQGDYVWWEFVWAFGGKLFDKNGKIAVNSKETLEALKWLLALDKEGLLAPGTASMTGSDLLKMLYSNKLGGWSGNKGNLSNLQQAVKDGTIEGPAKIKLYPYPTKAGISPTTAIGPTGMIMMTKDAAKQKAAAAFMEYSMQSKWHSAAVKSAGQLPSTKSVADMGIYKGDELGEVMQDIVGKYPAGDFGLSNPNYGKIRKELAAQLQAMFAGLKTPEQTLADLDASLKKIVGQ